MVNKRCETAQNKQHHPRSKRTVAVQIVFFLVAQISLYLKFNGERWLANRRAQLRTKPPSPISLSRPDDEPAVDDSFVCFAAALTLVSEIGGKAVAIELHGPDKL